MKKIKNIWIYSFAVIGVALMISSCCKKKDDNPTPAPTPQVPVFTITADSMPLQSGGEGLQFFGLLDSIYSISLEKKALTFQRNF